MLKPWHYTSVFILILALFAGISFLGYRYLLVANAYREANFDHLDATYRAIEILRQNPAPSKQDIDRLLDLANEIRGHTSSCVNALTRIEVFVFERLGGADLFQTCRDAIATATLTIEFLEALGDRDNRADSSMTSLFILYNNTITSAEALRDQSLSLQPYVTRLQDRIEVLVKSGTAVVSVLLAIISALVARQLTRARDEIEQRSLTDSLTNLANRRKLDARLAARLEETAAVLIRVDLDRFKQVNDILGHEAGDHVLKHVAEIMRSQAREGDLLARVGGDEFVILCAQDTPMYEAEALAQALLEEVRKPLSFGGKECLYGASFGIAASDRGGMTPSELLNAADKALYKAKSAGRGTVETYTKVMHEEARRERALADRLTYALANFEIVPYFQTQHDAHDWSIKGAEVLARWQHPDHGVLAPGQFLNIASQLGLEAEVDAAIFQQTLDVLRALNHMQPDMPRIAFNVSAARLTEPEFIAVVKEGIPVFRENFCFEILETISYEDSSDSLIFAIDTLKELGFEIDVDDFGSGHASINSVLSIEPDALKLDRGVVAHLDENPRSQRMVASIVEFARSLDVKVIAEGVDSEAKARLLRDLGCNTLQGYFFSKPMPAADFEACLAQNRIPADEKMLG